MEKGRIKRKGLRAKGEGFFLENEKKKYLGSLESISMKNMRLTSLFLSLKVFTG